MLTCNIACCNINFNLHFYIACHLFRTCHVLFVLRGCFTIIAFMLICTFTQITFQVSVVPFPISRNLENGDFILFGLKLLNYNWTLFKLPLILQITFLQVPWSPRCTRQPWWGAWFDLYRDPGCNRSRLADPRVCTIMHNILFDDKVSYAPMSIVLMEWEICMHFNNFASTKIILRVLLVFESDLNISCPASFMVHVCTRYEQ